MPGLTRTRRRYGWRFIIEDEFWTTTMLCELCYSEEVHNFHHFIPRTLHSNKWFKKRYTREQMQEGMNLCKSCHKAIHDLIPNEKKLGRHYNTMEKLLAHPQVAGYVKWKRERGPKANN